MAAQFYIPTRDAQEFQFLSLTVVFDNKRPHGCEVVPSLPFKHLLNMSLLPTPRHVPSCVVYVPESWGRR